MQTRAPHHRLPGSHGHQAPFLTQKMPLDTRAGLQLGAAVQAVLSSAKPCHRSWLGKVLLCTPHPCNSGCSHENCFAFQIAIPSKGTSTASFQTMLSTSFSPSIIPLFHTLFPELLESIAFCICKITLSNPVNIVPSQSLWKIIQSINPLENSKRNRTLNDCVFSRETLII